jgi:hypothetical protein
MIDDLGSGNVLGHRMLVPAADRDAGTGAAAPIAGVRCGRPLIYPIAVADLPELWAARARATRRRYLGMLLAFDLDPLPVGRRYTAARFDVTLTSPDTYAVRLDDGDSLGVTYEGEPTTAIAARAVAAARNRNGWLRRLTGRAGAPRAWTTGLQSASFGWVHEDPAGTLLVPRNYGMHALLEAPAGDLAVQGRIAVQAEVSGGPGRQLGNVREGLAFAEPLTADTGGRAAVRLCMAADVAGYSRRRNDETERIQATLVDLLSRARRAAGVTDAEVDPQPQGDGQFTVLPVGLDEAAAIPRLLSELAVALHEANAAVPPTDRIRLRVAFHRGLVKPGRNGWIGNAPIAVHRILDSTPLRRALAENSSAAYVSGFPDVLYRDVLVHGDGPPSPDDLQPITVDLPDKGFLEHCWLYLGPDEPEEAA